MTHSKAGVAWAASALLSLALIACGSDSDPGPGDVTVGEARALGEAAEMLDAQRSPAPPPPSATPSEAR